MENLPSTAKELSEKYGSPKNTNVIHHERLTFMDKLALFVTNKIGTMGFFFIIFFWSFVWLLWNIYAPSNVKFDPYPAFVLWLFISNLIQIHLMPLIMVGQNLQGKHSELRAENDYETNVKAEKQIETILIHLENQQKLIKEILLRIESLEKEILTKKD